MPTDKPSRGASGGGGAWPPDPAAFEKLGTFYLGRTLDPSTQAPSDAPILYDARDLTTHAVIVGMTGSGKTGLGISLLEEAAIDGIPAIAIDPKGDLGNLLLAFPGLAPADFRPWVDEGEAARAGLDADAFAARTATTWRDGLAQWGEDGGRIARYRDAARASIYTPGARAGLPLSVLRSLAAPAPGTDPQEAQERIATTVAGLLALLGIESDPLRGREAILLSTLIASLGASGRDASLAELVRGVQSPPFDRVGVLDLESFYPARDRSALAVALNNLLASPGFAAWTEGEPLEARRLLYTGDGQPRLSVVSIAHLSDAERMFFVTLLLNEVLAWVRTLPGTGSLRAILYMDEVFGYFPPTANPPSKPPMLTLLKQARAYGLGIVLATQNPVDLDYKGLSNAGTWFLGRLQTERDKGRVIEGLEGASAARGAAFDRAAIDRTLAGLKSRVFLMSNAHEDAPALMQTRWTLSYLRGPLTRPQIQTLMAGRAAAAAPARSPAAGSNAAPPDRAAAAPAPGAAPAPQAGAGGGAERPVVPPEIPQLFSTAGGDAAALRPAILAEAKLHYVDAKNAVDSWETVRLVALIGADRPAPSWSESKEAPPAASFATAPLAAARYAGVPGPALRARSYADWSKTLSDYLYQGRMLTLVRAPELKLASRPGESPGDFRVRLRDLVRERRDAEVEKLRARFAPKLASLEERARRADQRVERERDQFNQQSVQTAISVGATVLGALFGRRMTSVGNLGRATTAMRGAGRTMREHGEIGQAQESAEAVRGRIAGLEAELKSEIEALQSDAEPKTEEIAVRPRKADIVVERLALAWIPAD